MIFLGVDGGGTKTAFAIGTKQGQILGSAVTETSHVEQIGLDGVRKTLNTGIEQACKMAGVKVEDIDYAIWGLPGFGEDLDNAKALVALVGEIMGKENYRCVNDVEVGWAGSLACQPGLHLVAGTGAIGFGKDLNGKIARSSGWSELFGDEGSAYWLGIRLLELFSKQSDYRLPKSPLYNLVRDFFQIKRDFDLIPIIYDRSQRNEIAKIGRLVYEAAILGDKYAIELYDRAAFEHSLTIKALLEQLDFPADQLVPVSYSGGVFNAGEFIIKPLEKYLESFQVKLQKPKLSPILGAVLYAMEEAGVSWDQTTLTTLQKHELNE